MKKNELINHVPYVGETTLISDLGEQGGHFQSQLLVDGKVSRYDGFVGLIGQQQPLPLRLPPHLEREVEPGDGKEKLPTRLLTSPPWLLHNKTVSYLNEKSTLRRDSTAESYPPTHTHTHWRH